MLYWEKNCILLIKVEIMRIISEMILNYLHNDNILHRKREYLLCILNIMV